MAAQSQERIFIKGNEAVARGALAAGCKCYFGYPITPQNDIPEFMSTAMFEAGGSFVQAESEVAAINMLLGAGSTGVKAMTSSSSPGISLMQEGISYMVGSQIAGVIVNMNRGGPGLGDISPGQGDYFQATKGLGHGDTHAPVLAPATCQEAYDHMVLAFDLAYKYRSPVVVLGDAILAQMKEPVTPWTPENIDPDPGREWELNGAGRHNRPARLFKSLFLEDGALAAHNRVLQAKYQSMQKEARSESFETADAKLVVVAYGSIGRIAKTAVRKLRKEGHPVGLFRPVTLYPYPYAELAELARQGKRFLTIEHNLGQMVEDVRLAVAGSCSSDFYGHMPGDIPSPGDFEAPILDSLRRLS